MPFTVFGQSLSCTTSYEEKPSDRYDTMFFSTAARIYFRVFGQRRNQASYVLFKLGPAGGFDVEVWRDKSREWEAMYHGNIKKLTERDGGGGTLYSQLTGTLVAFAWGNGDESCTRCCHGCPGSKRQERGMGQGADALHIHSSRASCEQGDGQAWGKYRWRYQWRVEAHGRQSPGALQDLAT